MKDTRKNHGKVANCRRPIFLSVLIAVFVISGWSLAWSGESAPWEGKVDQTVYEATKIPESEWNAVFSPPVVEPIEVSPRPLVVSESSNAVCSDKKSGDIVVFGAPDYSTAIIEESWSPKVSRGENGVYYAAVQRQYPDEGIALYRCEGNPAEDGWIFMLYWYNIYGDILLYDCEAVTSDDRIYILYRYVDDDVAVRYYDISTGETDANIIDAALGSNYGSLASDEVEFNGGVYVYACWTSGQEFPYIRFSRSTDQGESWEAPVNVTITDVVEFMYMGNSIAYCPDDNHLFISYTIYDGNYKVKVAECSNSWGTGTWSSTTVLVGPYDFTSCGIACMYDDYILAAAHAPMSGTDLDVVYTYSDDAGSTWEGLQYFDYPGDQTYPSVAANDDGYFSLFYYAGDLGRMESARTTYDNLVYPAVWSYSNVDNTHEYDGINSACMEDGGSYPNHGGAWSDGTTSAADSYFGWNDYSGQAIEITLHPHDPPITIPASGGSFTFNVEIENLTISIQYFDVWTWAIKPNGTPTGPLLGPFLNVNLGPGGSYMSSDKAQNVPSWAPSGTYYYAAYVGDYPDDIMDADSFAVEKLAGGDGMVIGDWFCDGGDLFDETTVSANLPEEYMMASAYPNPFNPTTNINFALPAGSKVMLSVYDVSGRLVETLVDGYRNAGVHEVTFDASNLPSGVYLYSLNVGDFSSTGKMVLIK